MMNIELSDNIRVFCALLRRDLYILSRQLKDFLIDGAIIIITRATLFCYLLPAMGMPEHFIGPAYIGGIISLLLNLNFAQAMLVVFDLKFNRFIDYQLTLPIDPRWLWLQKVLSIAINVFFITAPLIGAGIAILSLQISNMNVHPLPLLGVYLVSLLFLATFILGCAINYSYDWFMLNIWPRRLTLMFCLGGVLFPWKAVYAFSPVIGRFFLLNPCTYIAEGFRSALLGGNEYISYTICIPVIIGFIGLAWAFLLVSIRKRFDRD
jgi:ABC-type polysaccharide/polyol phosphate export permease